MRACYAYAWLSCTHRAPVLCAWQCAHCGQRLERIAIRHGKLRNSTLSTLSQHCKSHLTHLDLSYTTGFDDLGLKSFAV